MALFLGRVSYTSAAVTAMVDTPQDRYGAATALVESVGGTLVGLWWALGDFDVMYIIDVPDAATATGLAMALANSGAFAKMETTALLDMDEAQEAMRAAARAWYAPPS